MPCVWSCIARTRAVRTQRTIPSASHTTDTPHSRHSGVTAPRSSPHSSHTRVPVAQAALSIHVLASPDASRFSQHAPFLSPRAPPQATPTHVSRLRLSSRCSYTATRSDPAQPLISPRLYDRVARRAQLPCFSSGAQSGTHQLQQVVTSTLSGPGEAGCRRSWRRFRYPSAPPSIAPHPRGSSAGLAPRTTSGST